MYYFVKFAQPQRIYLQMAAGGQGLGGTQITPTMISTPHGHPLSTPWAARSFAFAIDSTCIMVTCLHTYRHACIFSGYTLCMLHAIVACSLRASRKSTCTLVLLDSVSL